MMIGKWSEESSEEVFHSVLRKRSGLLKVMSGEVGWVRFEKGLRVGAFGLFKIDILSSWERRRDPLGSSCWVSSQDES